MFFCFFLSVLPEIVNKDIYINISRPYT